MKSPRKVGPDFHLVELTAEGKALAGGTPLRISKGRISVLFPPDGSPVKVARYEWDLLLRDHASIHGHKLFQVVPDEPETEEVTEAPAVEAKEND